MRFSVSFSLLELPEMEVEAILFSTRIWLDDETIQYTLGPKEECGGGKASIDVNLEEISEEELDATMIDFGGFLEECGITYVTDDPKAS